MTNNDDYLYRAFQRKHASKVVNTLREQVELEVPYSVSKNNSINLAFSAEAMAFWDLDKNSPVIVGVRTSHKDAVGGITLKKTFSSKEIMLASDIYQLVDYIIRDFREQLAHFFLDKIEEEKLPESKGGS